MNKKGKIKALLGSIAVLCKEVYELIEKDKELLNNPEVFVFHVELRMLIARLRGLEKHAVITPNDVYNKLTNSNEEE